MKKLFLILTVAIFALGTVNVFAQEAVADSAAVAEAVTEVVDQVAETEIAGETMHHVMMQKFLEGGWAWMLPILIFLVIGLAVAIERILYLALSTINTKKFVAQVEETVKTKGIAAAKELCRNTRGPIASIYYQGLDRYDQGLDAVEKSVVSYGSVQTGQMESGLTWIGLFIALSPMLGFMGTVVGMIAAFDQIQAAGDISPTLVAGGIKVALLTTLMGLIAAVILQIFYNYIVSKIDSLVNDMEDASISLMDILTAYSKKYSQGLSHRFINMKKVLNILLGILMAITAALLIYAVASPHSGNPAEFDQSISLNIIWGYILFVLAIASAVFCAIWGMVKNPKGIKGSLLSLLLILIVIGAAYFFSASHTVNIPDLQNGGFFDHGATVLTETSIIVTYVAFIAAFLTAIGTEIYRAFK